MEQLMTLADLSENKAISQEQKEEYQRNGFLRVINVCQKEEINHYSNEIKSEVIEYAKK